MDALTEVVILFDHGADIGNIVENHLGGIPGSVVIIKDLPGIAFLIDAGGDPLLATKMVEEILPNDMMSIRGLFVVNSNLTGSDIGDERVFEIVSGDKFGGIIEQPLQAAAGSITEYPSAIREVE